MKALEPLYFLAGFIVLVFACNWLVIHRARGRVERMKKRDAKSKARREKWGGKP